jgi:hypothetical protein
MQACREALGGENDGSSRITCRCWGSAPPGGCYREANSGLESGTTAISAIILLMMA